MQQIIRLPRRAAKLTDATRCTSPIKPHFDAFISLRVIKRRYSLYLFSDSELNLSPLSHCKAERGFPLRGFSFVAAVDVAGVPLQKRTEEDITAAPFHQHTHLSAF